MAVHVERLERLASLLADYVRQPAGDVTFDLDEWSLPKYSTKGHLWWKREVQCGTTACAVGFACLSTIFARDGLTYVIDHFDGGLVPIFAGKSNWPAVETFFGLS